MSAEYNELDSEDEEMDKEPQQSSRGKDTSLKTSPTPERVEVKAEPAGGVDPALADWLKVDAKQMVIDDSATEPESDAGDADSVNDDVDKDTDEWVALESTGSETLDSFQVLVRSFVST